ncbi:MAG: tetratricopeptide repeat protein, partial [Kofleriaceae bacterium]
GYRPLEAELASLVGHLEEDAEHFVEARAHFEQAVLAGDAGRDDPLVTRALISLAELLDHDLARTAEADTVLARIRAQLERLDHPKELETDALVTSGRNHLDAGRLDAGAADLARAIASIEQRRGAKDLELVEPLRVAASLEMQRDHTAVAHGYLDRALARQRGVVGEQHPDYAYTIEELAGAEYQEGHYDRAVALYRQALAVLEPTYGTDGVTVAGIQTNLANVLEWQGDSEGALAMFRRAAEISAKGRGPDHPRTLTARYGIGATLEDLGRHDEALAELTDVLARQQRVLGVHQQTATTLHMIGFVELWLHRYQPARDHARAALAMMKQTLGASYGGSDELATIGSAELGLGNPHAALAAFTQAEAGLEGEVDPTVKAYLDARYGQALIEANTDRAKGLALYRAAYKILAADERSAENRAQLDAWAKRHGI